jgi:hypothetical protein
MKLSQYGGIISLIIEPGDCPAGYTPEKAAVKLAKELQAKLNNPLSKLMIPGLVEGWLKNGLKF